VMIAVSCDCVPDSWRNIALHSTSVTGVLSAIDIDPSPALAQFAPATVREVSDPCLKAASVAIPYDSIGDHMRAARWGVFSTIPKFSQVPTNLAQSAQASPALQPTPC
jgi:hypothetical protein